MGVSNDAVSFIFASLVSMEPMAAEIVKGTMSDLAVKASPISRHLPNVTFWGACTRHIMSIDFPQNVGHVPDYENLNAVSTKILSAIQHHKKFGMNVYLMAVVPGQWLQVTCKRWLRRRLDGEHLRNLSI